MTSMRQRSLAGLVTAAALCGLAACGTSDATVKSATAAGRIPVVANFYPVQEAAQRVGGRRVTVSDLTPIGGEPHDLELSPSAVQRLDDAKVVLYMGRGFQPQVEKAVRDLPSSTTRVDLLKSVDLLPVQAGLAGTNGKVDGETLHGGVDPHVWVDPHRFVQIAATVAKTLERVDPNHAGEYQVNLAAYTAELDRLDRDFSAALAQCRSRTIVTSHRAFGYFAQRYHLEQVAIAGISPDEEPDPQSLEAVADEAKRKHVEVIFFESLVPKKLSQTIANEIGASTDSLNPVEGLTQPQVEQGLTYEKIQRQNLASLVNGLRCRH
jgi:zinc transport system substrate-binding protein